jgi:FSR family fosmidomycin resistance protein-like MFS transporter
MDSRYFASLLLHIMNDGTVFLLPSVLPLVVFEYGFSYVTAGYISAIIPLCLGLFQTPVGRVSDRFSNALLLRIGILIVGLGAFSVYFPQALLLSLALIGVGGSFYHPVGYAYTSKIMKNGTSGTALGIQASSGEIGTLAAFITAGPLAVLAGWRAVFVAWGLMCLATFLLATFMLREEPPRVERPKSAPSNLSLLKTKPAILIMALFAILGATYRIISNYLPSIFFLQGADIILADILSALLIAMGIVGGIVGGRMVDRYNSRTVTLALFGASALGLLGMYASPSLALTSAMVCVVGIAITALYPIFYFLMKEATSVSIVGVSYGLLLSLGMLSGIISLMVGGYLIEYDPKLVFLFGALLALSASIVASQIRSTNVRQ